MNNATAQCASRVQDRAAGWRKLLQNVKKILFRGNEPKNLLNLKKLPVLRLKDEPKFEHQKRKSNPRIWLDPSPETVPLVIPSVARNLALRGGSDLKAGYEGRERTRARFLAALGMTKEEGALG